MNFAANAFISVSLVLPISALAFMITPIIATRVLSEKLNFFGKFGCLMCFIGSLIMANRSPKANEIEDFDLLIEKLCEINFLIYVGVAIGISVMIAIYSSTQEKQTTILAVAHVFIGACAGSFGVVCVKVLGAILREYAVGKSNYLCSYYTFGALGIMVLINVVIIHYLNKALDVCDACVLGPTFFVLISLLIPIISQILFDTWTDLPVIDLIICTSGYLIIVLGLTFLHGLKQSKFSMRKIFSMFKRSQTVQIQTN